MNEKQGFNTVFLILIILSVWCLYMFLITNLDEFKDINSIYFLLNIVIFWKFFLGLKRYEYLVEKGILTPSGFKILQHTLIKFY